MVKSIDTNQKDIMIRHMTLSDFQDNSVKKQLINVMQNEEESIYSSGQENSDYGTEEFDKLERYFSQGKAVVSLMFESDSLIGYVWYFKISEDTVHLNEISILPEFRGGG